MKLDVVNLQGKKVSSIDLLDEVFSGSVREDIIARVVHWQMAKRRAGTHKTKEVGDISGTTKKSVKQKGTGGARHGSRRAPQFRGGAVIFGPVVRSHEYSLPKKIRKAGLLSALRSKLQGNDLIVMDNFDLKSQKTKDFVSDILGKHACESALFIDQDVANSKLAKATGNLFNMNVLPPIGANVLDIIKHQKVIVTEKALADLQERLK